MKRFPDPFAEEPYDDDDEDELDFNDCDYDYEQEDHDEDSAAWDALSDWEEERGI